MFLSIDFEDFNHDLKRSLGLSQSSELKVNELSNKYHIINQFLKDNCKGKSQYITFFCTGIIAKKAPELIREISNDGHEIACHSYHHDLIINMTISKVKDTILRAKEVLEDAANQKVKGFRAPDFAINKESKEQYHVIESLFEYDSSLFCSKYSDVKQFKTKMNLHKLKILPIYSSFIGGISLKLGGSYLKIFPKFYSTLLINNSIKAGLEPHIYLHPYEFDKSNEFNLQFSDLQKLGLRKSFYWKLRQNQWLNFNNGSTKEKLSDLIANNPLKGKLCDFAKSL